MAGAECVWPTDEKSAETLISQALESGDWGLVLVDEKYQQGLSQKLLESAFESVSPVVVFVSLSLKQGESPENQISELVRQAIGYSIKIREE